ncbi:hypothetical protein J6590_059060 [Homalodisca vitripennis]|nr:hypothetical protein J6590_059060 [Homalodisca vitripennis]
MIPNSVQTTQWEIKSPDMLRMIEWKVLQHLQDRTMEEGRTVFFTEQEENCKRCQRVTPIPICSLDLGDSKPAKDTFQCSVQIL